MTNLRSLLLACLLLGVGFAGCAENGGDGGTSGNTTTTPGGATPTGTTPTGSTPGSGITSIKVGTEAAYPPFEDTLASGEIVGFDIDVMREIGNRSGFTVTFQNAAFDAIIPSVNSGQFQAGISAFTITDERRQQVAFSVPYYENQLMVATLASNTGITKQEDLRGKRVCTQTGTTSEEWLRENTGHQDADLMLLSSFPPCAEALKRNDVQAIMIDRAAVRDLIQKSNGELREAFTVDTDEQFGIVVAKDNAVLLQRVNTALVAMKQDGTLERLQDKWNV